MGVDTKIQWCHHSWSPWRGCTKVSAGCAHCYAEKLSHRNPGVLGEWGPNGKRIVAAESSWKRLHKWNKQAEKEGERRRVFPSLCDPFEAWNGPMHGVNGNPLWWCYGSLSNSPIPSTGLPEGCRMATMDDIRHRLFRVIENTPWLEWMLLTKRPENWRKCWPVGPQPGQVPKNPDEIQWKHYFNLWMGVSVENQETFIERVPLLQEIPAAKRFLSVEPLLGPIDFSDAGGKDFATFDVWRRRQIDWVIVGGESGPNARPCNLAWIRSVARQCRIARVPCFVKQLGSNAWESIGDDRWNDHPRRVILKDPKGGDPDEWPEDLRVREVST